MSIFLSDNRARTDRPTQQEGRPVFALAVLVMLSFLGAPGAFAQGGADYSVEISQKFGRGLLNVLSSPLEIPCGVRDDVREQGAAGTFTGLFKGIAFFARRVLVSARWGPS